MALLTNATHFTKKKVYFIKQNKEKKIKTKNPQIVLCISLSSGFYRFLKFVCQAIETCWRRKYGPPKFKLYLKILTGYSLFL